MTPSGLDGRAVPAPTKPTTLYGTAFSHLGRGVEPGSALMLQYWQLWLAVPVTTTSSKAMSSMPESDSPAQSRNCVWALTFKFRIVIRRMAGVAVALVGRVPA